MSFKKYFITAALSTMVAILAWTMNDAVTKYRQSTNYLNSTDETMLLSFEEQQFLTTKDI